jgi:hypothetical protein
MATPEPINDWSLTRLKEKLIKIGAKGGELRPLRRIAGAQARCRAALISMPRGRGAASRPTINRDRHH